MADGSLHPPEAHPVVSDAPHTASLLSRALAARQALEAALEAALAVLDDMDGDTDLEPVNGSTLNPDQRHWAAGGDDGEREPSGDDEPSLGGFDPFGSTQDMEEEFGGLGDRTDQRRWAQDHGEEGDGAVDDEPALGSIATTDQRHWTGGPTGKARNLDREQACEDEGAQCDDEGAPGYEGVPSYGMDQVTPARLDHRPVKPRPYAAGAPAGHYTHAEVPLRVVLQRLDAETVSGLLDALRAALVAHDALIDELDLLMLPPATDAHLWDTAKAAFLSTLPHGASTRVALPVFEAHGGCG